MPGFDRTGPMGFGPATGRGMGYCGAYCPGFHRLGGQGILAWVEAAGADLVLGLEEHTRLAIRQMI